MTPIAVKAADLLAVEGIQVTVVNMRFVQPLDAGVLDRIARTGKPVITVEENITAGGFGSAVLEYYAAKGIAPEMTLIGIPEEFPIQATRKRLLDLYGLDAASIAEKVRTAIKVRGIYSMRSGA